MRVIPADNALAGEVAILDFVNVLPGVLREGDVRAALCGIGAGDASADVRATVFEAADQDATDFVLEIRAGMLANLARHFGADADVGVFVLAGFGHQPPPWASGPRPPGAPPPPPSPTFSPPPPPPPLPNRRTPP